MSYAPPIVYEPFSYSGNSFYVTIDGNRHERADPETLHRHLTYIEPPPLLTKAGKIAKRQPPPHKDPPGHFYCAQLLHYALTPRKTKEAAKKQLLTTLAAKGSLSVPKHILELEERLREEYRQASDIAKKKYEEEERAKDDALQRRRDAIMQEFIDVDAQDSESPNPDEIDFEFESAGNEISHAQLRDAIASLPEKRLRQILVKLVDEIPAVERAMKKEVGSLPMSETTAKTSKGKGKQKSKSRRLKGIELKGEFEVTAPYLSEQWPDDTETMTLQICPSSTGSHLWAYFDFGIVSGIIRSTLPPPTSTGVSCPFLWRGRESGEGEMSFGPENQGSLVFLGDGKIRGRMEWMAGFDFVGIIVNRPNAGWSKSVKGWKAQWRGLNLRSYESERVGRWGGWQSRDSVPDKPSLSDTSGGGMKDVDDDDQGSEGSDYDMAY